MKRRILLVDDEVAVLLTLKAVLEISGFDVDTAASGREGVSRLHTHEYDMLITDMRMEHDAAGIEVIKAARAAAYRPAVALLTAFPVAEEDWQEMGADQLLVKPMNTRVLLQQIEDLIVSQEQSFAKVKPAPAPAKRSEKKSAAKKPVAKKAEAKKTATVKKSVGRSAAKKIAAEPVKRSAAKSKPAAKKAAKKSFKTSAKSAGKRRT
jgi:DNA-binding response OmpR family regulator